MVTAEMKIGCSPGRTRAPNGDWSMVEITYQVFTDLCGMLYLPDSCVRTCAHIVAGHCSRFSRMRNPEISGEMRRRDSGVPDSSLSGQSIRDLTNAHCEFQVRLGSVSQSFDSDHLCGRRMAARSVGSHC